MYFEEAMKKKKWSKATDEEIDASEKKRDMEAN